MNPDWLEQKLFPLYRWALRGNPRALDILVRYGVHCLENGQELPRGVARMVVRELRDPARHAARMARTITASRGHPSIDDLRRSNLTNDLAALAGKRYFGRLPSEKNALIIQYLLSRNHTLNVAPGRDRDSAVTVLAGLVNRSAGQLQRDYYAHRSKLTGSPSQLGLGKSLIDGRRRLYELRTMHQDIVRRHK